MKRQLLASVVVTVGAVSCAGCYQKIASGTTAYVTESNECVSIECLTCAAQPDYVCAPKSNRQHCSCWYYNTRAMCCKCGTPSSMEKILTELVKVSADGK